MGNVIFIVLFTIGVYLILVDVLEIPTYGTIKSILRVSKQDQSKEKQKTILYTISQNFVGYVRLNEYNRIRMEQTLDSVGASITPEMYYVMGFVKLAFYVIAAVMFAFIFPLFSVVVIILGINTLYSHMREPEKILSERRREVDSELPRLTSIIQQELNNGNSIIVILENYQQYAGEYFAKELRLTLADMRSGNHESALLRLEGRVGSNELSKVVRGMIRAITGDNATQYFEMINNEFRMVAVNTLRKDALKNPSKINKYSFMVLIMAVITIMTVLVVYMIEEIPNIF